MALDAGIAALQLLYKLAKMIKETRENIIIVRDKLDDTETIAKLIDLKLNLVDAEACPPEILEGIRTRFAQAKRVARKLRLKYDPLLPLVTSLGGNATLVKAQAAMMRKGVLGASMALGSLSVILWRYVHRTDQRVHKQLLEALIASGVPVEKYMKMPLTEMIEVLKDQQAGGLLALLSNPLDIIGSAGAMRPGDVLHGIVEKSVTKGKGLVKRALKATKEVIEEVEEEADEIAEDIDDTVSTASSKIGHHHMSQQDFFARAESQREMLQKHLKVDSATLDNVLKRAASKIQMAAAAVDTMKGLLNESNKMLSKEEVVEEMKSTSIALNAVSTVKGMFSRVTNALSSQSAILGKGLNTALESVENAVGNPHLLDSIQGALHLGGENNEEAEKTHFQLLHEHGYYLETYSVQHQANEALRGMLEMIDHLNQELKILNNDAKTYDNDDGEIDAGDDLIPQVEKKHNSKDRKHFVHEGVDLLMEFWFEGKQCLNRADIKRVMGKGYNKSNLNLLWRYLRKQDASDQEACSLEEEVIRAETLCRFLQASSGRNLGLALCAIEICILNLMNKSNMPNVIAEAMDIVTTMLNPLIGYTASFGLLIALEEIRESVKDDPQEIAILEAEMDEEALERRLGLVRAFASDFKDSIEHGFAPDPSLMLSIAVEVSTSFVGLGPTTKRRLQLLQSIVGLTSIEADVRKIEKVDTDLKAEVAMMQSLPVVAEDLDTEHFDRLRADQAALGETTKSIVEMLGTLKENFDVRGVLGDQGEAADFWVSNFGKECYEVHWQRFLAALKMNYSDIPPKHLEKVRMMLVDVRGHVTALQLQQLVSFNGSLATVITKLAKRKQLPKTLQAVQDRPSTKGENTKSQLPEMPRNVTTASGISRASSWEDSSNSSSYPSSESPSTAPSRSRKVAQSSQSSPKLPKVSPPKKSPGDDKSYEDKMRTLFGHYESDFMESAKSSKSLGITRQSSIDSLCSSAASSPKSPHASAWNMDTKQPTALDRLESMSKKNIRDSKNLYFSPELGMPASLTPTEKRQARVRLYNV
eukprot:gene32499-39293_t